MGGLNRVVSAGAGSAVTSEGGGATGAGPAASDRPPAGAVVNSSLPGLRSANRSRQGKASCLTNRTARWRALAAEAPEAFFGAQHAFIEKTHFAPLVRRIRLASGFDITSRSHALQDASR
jgi:hypothetical protein